MANIKTLSETLPILSFSQKYEPLWAGDTGRNSNSGAYSGTFIGYFSQIVIEFGKTTQEQMNTIKSTFETSVFSLTYPSTNGTNVTEQFYGTAIEGKKDYWDGKYMPFSITLTAIKKRS